MNICETYWNQFEEISCYLVCVGEDSQIDFFPRNVLWTFEGGEGFCPVTFL